MANPLSDPEDLRNAVENLRREIEALKLQVTNASAADEVFDNLGDLPVKAVDEDGNIRAIISPVNLSEELGIDAHFALLGANGAPQVWGSADTGQVVAGGGDVTLGDAGEVIKDHVPLEFKQKNNFIGDNYSSYIFGENTTARLYMLSGLNRNGSNKVIDGDFESGTLSNWNVSAANAEIVEDYVHGGAYALHISPLAVPSQEVVSAARFTVTAGNVYLLQLYTDRVKNGADFRVQIKYYDALTAGTLLQTATVLREDRNTDTWQRSVCLPSIAPAGATHAEIRIELGASADTWLDDLLLVDVSSMTWARALSDGWEFYRGAIAQPTGYALHVSASQFSPADATTYYFGGSPSLDPTTAPTERRLYIPRAGKIRAAYIFWHASAVAGSGQNISAYIELNGAGDTLIETVGNTSATKLFDNTNLDIDVAAGDYIEVYLVCPTWGTNPTGVRLSGVIYID